MKMHYDPPLFKSQGILKRHFIGNQPSLSHKINPFSFGNKENHFTFFHKKSGKKFGRNEINYVSNELNFLSFGFNEWFSKLGLSRERKK